MASLTKIMTLMTTLTLAKTLNIDIYNSIVIVPKIAAQIGGTSAYLKEGDRVKLNDLFYAMMLPSGNDAAMAIANYFGEKLSELRLNFSQIV